MRHLLHPLPATGSKNRKINKFEHREEHAKPKTDITTEYSLLAKAVVMMRMDFRTE
jgi:hypothetical protein